MSEEEMNGHVEIVEQCRDWIDHETMDNGDPSGKLQDFSQSIRIVLADRDSLRLRVVELERERDEAVGANLAGLVADLRKTRADRDDADDAAWRRLLKVDELEAELDRYRPVIEAAKAWHAVRFAPFPEGATTINEMLEPEGRAMDALLAAIDSLSTKGPTNE